jgi:hypothetical protein
VSTAHPQRLVLLAVVGLIGKRAQGNLSRRAFLLTCAGVGRVIDLL